MLQMESQTHGSKGKGGGRPRGQGRRAAARGRGRGQGGRGRAAAGQNRIELAMHARQNRQTQIEERISSMDVESLRKTLALVCKREPSLLLDILDSPQDTNPAQEHMTTAPSWCTCSFCREMPTMQENVCCGKTPQNCHSQLADFYTIVLDELVLEVAIRSRNDALAEPRDIDYNKAHRHAAYRQYVMWIHGHLGAGNRKVIPSCCVLRIRDRYPDPSGHNIGYIEGVLGF